jgi:hypothetical protein
MCAPNATAHPFAAARPLLGALKREMADIGSTASVALADSEVSPAGAPFAPLPVRPKENHPMLVDLLAMIPACLAGIGGAFLGDKIGVWFKKTRTSGNG